MRGVPGSGKSTYIKTHFPQAQDYNICSADNFFLNEEGVYEFKPELLHEAHRSCYEDFFFSLQDMDFVIVDNTNIRLAEITPYTMMLSLFDEWDLRIIRLNTPPDIAASRNIHGVPESKVKRMAKAMETLPPYLRKFEEVV